MKLMRIQLKADQEGKWVEFKYMSDIPLTWLENELFVRNKGERKIKLDSYVSDC